MQLNAASLHMFNPGQGLYILHSKPNKLLMVFTNLILFFLFFSIPPVDSVSFNIPRFERSMTGITYIGDARFSSGAVELNLVDYLYRVGQVTYSEGIRLQDPETKQQADFVTHFSFTIDTQGRSSYGHGLAFFIAPFGFQFPYNSAAGFLGLFNTTILDSPDLNPIIAVEFDAKRNNRWDPRGVGSHVGINNCSMASAVYTPWNVSFHSGDTADVLVTYNATTKNFSVSWSYRTTNHPLENSSLSIQIDLTKVLPDRVTIGFSASTGTASELHTLYSWDFTSSLNDKDTNGGTEKLKTILAVTLSVSGALLIGVAAYFKFWRSKTRNLKNDIDSVTFTNDLENGVGTRRFSYKDLVLATNNFSDDQKVGQGGFGAVYKGHLTGLDISVAVKKITSSKQGKKGFVTEVQVISQLRHRNLVQLLGWCHDQGQFLLVYEFIPNGSLDSHLFGKTCSLTWAMRYKICLGLATALHYLHDEWEQCVVHRDIKASNVMLDFGYNVKLSDFGLARLMDRELGPQTTVLAGTLGYLAPEYISSRRPSSKSDVYSFGVVALEIATGRRSTEHEMGLVQWVWDLYGNKTLVSAVDERLQMEFNVEQAKCMMIVGLWCAHPDQSLRPSIKEAIQVLNFEAQVPNLPEKMPIPMYQVPSPANSCSQPLITNSFLEGGR